MKKKKKTLLWRIDGADLPGSSYLFGTMHVKDQRAFRYRELIYRAIDACEAFAIEFDLEEMDGMASPERMQLPNGATLDQLLPARKYEKMRRIFHKGTGIDIHPFRHLKPILISNLITQQLLSSDEAASLDEHLWHYARLHGRQVKGIETYREQLAIMERIPLAHQLQGLVHMARNFSRHRKQLLRMTELYESSDPARIFKAARRSAQEFRKLLLYDRNRIMADRIGAMIRQHTTFCGIGAGHLGGKKGVLRLLKLQGFRLSPISSPAEIPSSG